MAELKTRETSASVTEFLNNIPDDEKRQDCFKILELMKAATKSEPAMWGTSIVGFGRHQYKYESGTKGEWFVIGFSPRKQNLTLYLMSGVMRYKPLLDKLGKHKVGKGCLYINKLSDVDVRILKQIVNQTVKDIAAMKSR
jgi:hypothetical protein